MKFAQIRFAGSYPRYQLAPRMASPEIAFGGRSNVGKSSLINSLVNRKTLARVSRTPGKTRLLNYYLLTDALGREKLIFVDLPGFGYAKVAANERRRWKSLVEGYVENSLTLRGLVLLVDSRRGMQDEEMQLIEYLVSLRKKICPVLTKADKLSKTAASEIAGKTAGTLKTFGPGVGPPILHSSVKKTGNDLIWRWILERMNDDGE